MKKFILIKLITTIFAFISFTTLNAQLCPPPDGCTWSSMSTLNITTPCAMDVDYVTVICNGIGYYQILGIYASDDCKNNYTPFQLYKMAGENILKESWLDGYRPTDLDDCWTRYYSYSVECMKWHYEIRPNNNNNSLIPCSDVLDCCEGTWEICKTGEDPDTWSYFLHTTGQGKPCALECYTVCGDS